MWIFFVNVDAIDESTYIPPPFAVTTTPILIVTTLVLTRTHVETPVAPIFTPLESIATPMAPTFTMVLPSVVIANPPLEVSSTLNVQAINIIRIHSINIHGGQKVEEVAHVFTMPSLIGVIGNLPLVTSKAFDVSMNMSNSDVSGCTSIELTFGVCTKAVQVPPVVVGQKNGQVLRHRSSSLLSKAHGEGQPKEKKCCVRKIGGKSNLAIISSNAQL